MIVPDISLTRDDFLQAQWEDVITESTEKLCYQYSTLFANKAREAREAGNDKTWAVFSLLSAISSLIFQLDNNEEPFGPAIVFSDRRTAILDDFSDEQLSVLKELIPDITDPEMRARIADVLWLKQRPRGFGMVVTAIESYIRAADLLAHLDSWPPFLDNLERALHLALSLGPRNTKYLVSVVAYIEEVLDKIPQDSSGFLSARLMELLQECGQGDVAKYRNLAQRLANYNEHNHSWDAARTYWALKAKWDAKAGEVEDQRAALICLAETHVREAEGSLQQPTPNYTVAAHHYQSAIEAYRRIESFKNVAGLEAHVKELHKKLLQCQENAVAQMGTFTENADISQIIQEAVDSVKGKSLDEALLSLALGSSSPNVSRLRSQVEELEKATPLLSLLSQTLVNKDGRIVARMPSLSSNDSEIREAAISSRMHQNAVLHHRIHAVAVVNPAREQIVLEHNVRVRDLLPFVSNNPIVPPGRELIFAKGLHAGLTGDFLVSTHLLIPQLENSLRYILQQLGEIPFGLDNDGIQDAHLLDTVIESPRLQEVFGEDLVFDLKGLLVRRFGSNIRNELSHGLLSHNEFFAPEMCYLWWLILRLCCLVLVRQNGNEQVEDNKGSEQHENAD